LITAEKFWSGMSNILGKFAAENRSLLAERERIQTRIDQWHKANAGNALDQKAYQALLLELGYILPEPVPFKIQSKNVDAEVALMAGPQLVVPSLNDRFVLNAANARWGSLYVCTNQAATTRHEAHWSLPGRNSFLMTPSHLPTASMQRSQAGASLMARSRPH
jgi:malate synthase